MGCCACADIAARGNSRRPRTDGRRSRVEGFLQNTRPAWNGYMLIVDGATRCRRTTPTWRLRPQERILQEKLHGPEPGAPGERRAAAVNARRPGTSRSAEDGPEDERRRDVRARVQGEKRPPQERPAEPVAKARVEPRWGEKRMGVKLRQGPGYRRRPGPPPDGGPQASASKASSSTSPQQPSSAVRDSEDVADPLLWIARWRPR